MVINRKEQSKKGQTPAIKKLDSGKIEDIQTTTNIEGGEVVLTNTNENIEKNEDVPNDDKVNLEEGLSAEIQ
jgi:hypothetical protein